MIQGQDCQPRGARHLPELNCRKPNQGTYVRRNHQQHGVPVKSAASLVWNRTRPQAIIMLLSVCGAAW